MPVVRRLLQTGSMAGSMSVYLPAAAFQRVVALGRILLLLYLLPKEQYGLWGLGSMIFALGAPIVTLGSHLGLARYVSFYEARGRLGEFHRRVRWFVPTVIVAMTGLALAFSRPLAGLLLVSSDPHASWLAGVLPLRLFWAALANAALMAWYHNMQSFMAGMRVYRLYSALETVYALLFTGLCLAAMLLRHTAMAILLAHAVTLAAIIVCGELLLRRGVREAAAPPAGTPVEEPVSEATDIAPALPLSALGVAGQNGRIEGAFPRMMRFGLVALLGSLLWLGTSYVSFWLINHSKGLEKAGGFYAYLQLGQIILYLANAAWAVVFTHVAKRWEDGDRRTALFVFETAYKAVTLGMLTLTVLALLTAPLWVNLLPASYRSDLPLLGGLLMFSQVLANLSLFTILANLHHRPILIALVALAGGACNVLLASWLIPGGGPAWLPKGSLAAAWSAGAGMYLGGAAVTVIYLAATRTRFHPSTLLLFASPIAMFLPAWGLAAVLVALAAAAIFTRRLFSRRQKRILVGYLRKLPLFGRNVP